MAHYTLIKHTEMQRNIKNSLKCKNIRL